MRRDDLCEPVRRCLKRYPDPHASHYGVVPVLPPEHGVSILPVRRRHEEASAALARLEALGRELADPFLISRILARKEAVSSSAIEGTNSTLDEILAVEESADEAATAAANQVRDYALALETFLPLARQEGASVFTEALIHDLHRAVMQGDHDYEDVPGRLRSVVVWIGGRDIARSTYNPAPPEDVLPCLRQTLDYMRCQGLQGTQQSLLTRMAVAHTHFEAVHPFRDGNGRVGRLLLPLMMAADGHAPLYLSPYIEANKQAYHDALKQAQQRLEWEAVIGFLADGVVATVDELMATRNAFAELGADWRQRRKFREGSGALRALSLVPHYPVLTVARLAEVLHISRPAAGQAIGQLVDAGILREKTGYRRNRMFVAPEAISIINRPFGEAPN